MFDKTPPIAAEVAPRVKKSWYPEAIIALLTPGAISALRHAHTK